MLTIQIFNCLILSAMFVATKQEAAWRQQKENSQTFPGKIPKILGTKVKRSDKPNIIFIITDDQDAELGRLNTSTTSNFYLSLSSLLWRPTQLYLKGRGGGWAKYWGTVIPVYSWHTTFKTRTKRKHYTSLQLTYTFWLSKRAQHTKNCEG